MQLLVGYQQVASSAPDTEFIQQNQNVRVGTNVSLPSQYS